MIVINIEHTQVLFVLETISNWGRASLRYTIVIQKEHVEAHVGPQCSANFSNHCIIKLIFTKVNSAEFLFVGDAFAESFTESLGEFILTDI